MIRDFIKSYFNPNSDISSRRVNGLIVLLSFILVSVIGIFTLWVKNEHIYDRFSDICAFIIIAITVGVTATDAFDRFRRKKTEPVEPVEPVQPVEPVEPVKPVEPVEPDPGKKKDPSEWTPLDEEFNIDTAFIKKEEGIRLESYQCAARVWTIGAGNTTHPDGTKVKKGDRITEDQVDPYLRAKLLQITKECPLPVWLNRAQRTAVYSWIFNCGIFAWKKSRLKQLIDQKAPMDQVYQRWTTKWLTAQGGTKPILKPRRIREATMFTGGK